VPADVDSEVPEQRILEQSMRLTGGAVTGWASCRMQSAAFFDGLKRDGRTPIPVPLNCGPLHQIRRHPGDDLLRDILVGDEIVQVHGVPCTVVNRATFDAMRFAAHLREAVVALDMMAAAMLTSVRRMTDYIVPHHQAWTGVAQSREALALADEGSRSPQESRLRLVWVLDAGRRAPLVNRPVFDLTGQLLGYPDLFDPEAGVVGEYDGEDHRSAVRHSRDVGRESRFREHRLEVVRVTGADLRNTSLVIDRLESAFARAQRVPSGRRTWTLQPPPWWPRELSLDDRLTLRDQQARGLGAAS
jgi:hypothetical protein